MLTQHFKLFYRLTQRFFALASLATVSGCAIPGPTTNDKTLEAKIPRLELQLSAGYKLSYLAAGDPQGQTVIFVHGTPGDAEGWADYLMNVPKGYHYVAIDRPGFGSSGPDSAVVSLAEQSNAIADLITSLGGKAVALVGHSLGEIGRAHV